MIHQRRISTIHGFRAACAALIATASSVETACGPPPVSPPTDAECRKTADVFERLIRAGDAERATRLIDWDGILRQATSGFPKGPELDVARAEFTTGFMQNVRTSGGLAAQVAAAIEGGGSYRLLRIHRVDGEPRALFRLLLPEGGFNYHDLQFGRDKSGALQISDVHDALTGEFLSETLRRAFLPFVTKAKVAGLAEQDALYVAHIDDLTQLAGKVEQQQFADALALFRGLPPVLQANKSLLLIRLQAAQWAGDKEYAEAIADISKSFPNDLCVHLLSIDGLLLMEKYEPALATVDQVDEAVGGDPYLSVLRAGIHYRAGDLKLAESSARKAFAEDPLLEDAYWQVATVSLDNKDFDTTVEMLNLIQGRLQIELQDLTRVPEYAEFVKSPQYRKWRQAQNR